MRKIYDVAGVRPPTVNDLTEGEIGDPETPSKLLQEDPEQDSISKIRTPAESATQVNAMDSGPSTVAVKLVGGERTFVLAALVVGPAVVSPPPPLVLMLQERLQPQRTHKKRTAFL
jgi:hypothetical protein